MVLKRQLCALAGAVMAVQLWITLLSMRSASTVADQPMIQGEAELRLEHPGSRDSSVPHSITSLSPSPLPPPSRVPPSPSPSTKLYTCHTSPHTEYDGPVVIWGSRNVVRSADECCASCMKHREAHEASQPCVYWIYCGVEAGCATQKHGECWGKTRSTPNELKPRLRGQGERCPWTSGAVYTEAEAAAMREAAMAEARVREERRDRPGNPHVYFDIEITRNADSPSSLPTQGRVEFVLYAHESPRAAENFRAMCTGEKGGRLTYKGMRFYRILDMFIDQAGVHGVSSIWGEAFDDDPGGLLLKHDRPGLLSAANSGPDTNSGHFSIVVAPAPHLDTSYTIFGEVVQGMDIVMAVNALAPPSGASLGSAVVTAAGCLKNCDPRPQVTAKCKTRAHEERLVQGRSIHPCLD
ncbi:hypothetical protein AB1Y20_005125 [Prymnesium parvum]|uniref:PPIase cyclophilin-type domain-containing protein n=1 Tax=Prymnesium parvum TaxID=97485 RepID=A0AB34J4Z6_PRYPA